MKKSQGRLLIISIIALSTLMIAGCSSSKNTQDNVSVVYEEVTLGHDGSSLVPSITTLPRGSDYNITINPSENGQGCMSTIKFKGTTDAEVVIKDRKISFQLLDPEPGEYIFVCNGMGMRQGSIIIEA